jgi:hypothetical protein
VQVALSRDHDDGNNREAGSYGVRRISTTMHSDKC